MISIPPKLVTIYSHILSLTHTHTHTHTYTHTHTHTQGYCVCPNKETNLPGLFITSFATLEFTYFFLFETNKINILHSLKVVNLIYAPFFPPIITNIGAFTQTYFLTTNSPPPIFFLIWVRYFNFCWGKRLLALKDNNPTELLNEVNNQNHISYVLAKDVVILV